MKIIKNTTILALILLALVIFPLQAGRYNQTFTITAGTPVQVAVSTTPVYVKRVFIQMATGGTGRGYVLIATPRGRIPVATASSDLAAQLAPATATAPGGSYSDTGGDGNASTPDIDLSTFWLDGSHTGDTVVVSYELVQ